MNFSISISAGDLIISVLLFLLLATQRGWF